MYQTEHTCMFPWSSSTLVINREYVHSVAVYKKIFNEVGRIDNFRVLARKLSILSTELEIFDIQQHYVRIRVTYQRLILSSFTISNADKHEFSSIWKWSSCYNDVMIHVDCVIKRDVYLQKMHS